MRWLNQSAGGFTCFYNSLHCRTAEAVLGRNVQLFTNWSSLFRVGSLMQMFQQSPSRVNFDLVPLKEMGKPKKKSKFVSKYYK